jgi:hypothetical protein
MGCAVASLLVLVSPPSGIFFSAMGLIFAGAGVISVDEPASARTRRLAFLAAALAALTLAIGLIVLLTAPQER